MLEIKHITKVFYPGTVNEKTALENVSLTVNDGDVICVIGSNGSGKSTLFNLISGTYPVTSGEILLNGRNITHMPEYRRAFTIGRIFQDPTKGTAASMSIADNMITASTKGMKGLRRSLNKAKKEEFAKLLEPIGLSKRLEDNVGLLSGGQRQALTLLMTVMSKPQLVLLDEHTAALDPRNAQIVMDLTTQYINQYNLTALMVTHNMEFAINYGNRLIMMDGGQIVLDIHGEEKKQMTVSKLVELFRTVRNKAYDDDAGLLTT